jgi:hypothetical protein
MEVSMRYLAILCTVLSLPACVMAQVYGQATIRGGYASTWIAPPGAYATVLPLVETPIIDYAPPALQVGASNSTLGSFAGDYDSVVVETPPSLAVYGTSGYGAAIAAPATAEQSSSRRGDLGIATFQDDYGVATLAANARPNKPPVKVFTNEDIERLQNKQQ